MVDKVERVASLSKINIVEEKGCIIDSCYGDHMIFATLCMVRTHFAKGLN